MNQQVGLLDSQNKPQLAGIYDNHGHVFPEVVLDFFLFSYASLF